MKEFEKFLKALIECYATTKGNECVLPDDVAIGWGKKLRELIAEEIKQNRP